MSTTDRIFDEFASSKDHFSLKSLFLRRKYSLKELLITRKNKLWTKIGTDTIEKQIEKQTIKLIKMWIED